MCEWPSTIQHILWHSGDSDLSVPDPNPTRDSATETVTPRDVRAICLATSVIPLIARVDSTPSLNYGYIL